ncbi:type II toxin-antitoxin system VapC family toxin [Rhizobium sp.]
MIAVDTSIWIDVFRRVDNAGTRKFRSIAPNGDIVLGDVVLMELLQGARDDLHARRIQEYLAEFDERRMFEAGTAVKVARNFRILRGKGITVRKSVDMIIGTWCIENNVPLLHNDRDFAPMVEHLGLIEF